MSIAALTQVSSGLIQDAHNTLQVSSNSKANLGDYTSQDIFASMLNSAMDSVSQTNAYAQAAADEKMKVALGETESTHDLTIALEKSSTALQYTVAIRDKFLEAYNEIMKMQI
ncbi:MAG: flagellar hook-basal body complex protein FliE [Eubacteriales bacterium]